MRFCLKSLALLTSMFWCAQYESVRAQAFDRSLETYEIGIYRASEVELLVTEDPTAIALVAHGELIALHETFLSAESFRLQKKIVQSTYELAKIEGATLVIDRKIYFTMAMAESTRALNKFRQPVTRELAPELIEALREAAVRKKIELSL